MKTFFIQLLTTLLAALVFTSADAPAAQMPPNADTDYPGSGPWAVSTPTPPQSSGGVDSTGWQLEAPNSIARARSGGAWIGRYFYLIGGETQGAGRTGQVEVYDAATCNWFSLSQPMPIPVSNIIGSVAAIPPFIYVFGGYDASQIRRNEIQVLDTRTGSWTVAAQTLPQPAYGVLAVALPGRKEIFVHGGTPSPGVGTRVTFLFDPAVGINLLPQNPFSARFHLIGALGSDSKVYVGPGFGTGRTVECFDPTTRIWSQLPSLPVDRAGGGCIAQGDSICFFAGDWSNARDDANFLDIASRSYSFGAQIMNAPRRTFAHGHGSLALIHASGGWDGFRLDTTEQGTWVQ